MRRVAYLLSANVAPGRSGRRDDAWEVDGERAALAAAGRAAGIDLVPAVWDEAGAWAGFDAVAVRATWDYMEKPDAFLPAIESIAGQAPMFNTPATIARNLEKTYLIDLRAAGAPAAPTLLLDSAEPERIEAAFDALGAEEIVVKPVIGAASWRQARLRRGAPLPPPERLPPRRCLAQPFLPAVVEGEATLLYFNGAFSHALLKRPAEADYRTQSIFGARETPLAPSADQLSAAERALEAWGDDLLYARVDLVRGPGGEWLLMELELIEPYLYMPFSHDGEAAAAARFIAALDARL